jgi:hypothetical protein
VTTAMDKWPAYARPSPVAAAGHLPTAPTPLFGTRPRLFPFVVALRIVVELHHDAAVRIDSAVQLIERSVDGGDEVGHVTTSSARVAAQVTGSGSVRIDFGPNGSS